MSVYGTGTYGAGVFGVGLSTGGTMATTLARKYKIDVTTDLTLASGWTPLNGVDDWNDTVTPNIEDTTAYDTNGWMSREVTLQDWNAVASMFRRIVAGVYDPGQEIVRATRGQFGAAARCGIRWYDRNSGPEAYQGVALPAWTRANTGAGNVEKASATFNATDVPLTPITNPLIANPTSAPVVMSATPSGVGSGGQVTIVGVGFMSVTGAGGVKFGGTNATQYSVVSDNIIVAQLPTAAAGSASVTVTNPTGTSNALPYTRGA